VTGDITHTLKAEGFDASEDGTGRGQPIVPAPICFSAKDYGADATNDLSPTLRAGGFTGSHANGGVMPAVSAPPMAVRRLMPVECERLQAFPDSYTQVQVRGKPAADGPRYKALGNSMCVNVMRWIGERIDVKNLSANTTF
jgi:DNA (cytosine-5)-methyltransferase 1